MILLERLCMTAVWSGAVKGDEVSDKFFIWLSPSYPLSYAEFYPPFWMGIFTFYPLT
jgi:hypothetical protein